MSNIIDLGTMVKEDLVFRLPNGDEFVIPGQIDLNFVLKLSKLEEKLNNGDGSIEEQLKILQDIVLEILKLDKSQTVTLKYVRDNLSDINLLKVVMEHTIAHIENIVADENL